MSTTRLRCPACSAALTLDKTPPPGAALKCSNCGRAFRVTAPPKVAVPPAEVTARAPLPPPEDAADVWASLPAAERTAPTRGRPSKKRTPALAWGVVAGAAALLLVALVVGLWAAGIFSGRPDNRSAGKPAPTTGVRPIKDLLVGRWDSRDEKEGGSIEFRKDGTLSLSMADGMEAEGAYKFVGRDAIEVSLEVEGQKVTQKLEVEVTKDELVTTDEASKVERFKRSAGARPGPAQPAWAEFVSKEGGFSARFPGTPKSQAEGGLHLFSARAAGAEFTVGYSDVPAEALAGGAKQFLERVAAEGGKLKTKKEVMRGDFPGLELTREEAPDRAAPAEVARLWLVKGRLFSLSVSGKKGAKGLAQAARFFDSFKVLGGVPGPKVTSNPPTPPKPADGEWKEYVSKEGCFRVRFPGTPAVADVGRSRSTWVNTPAGSFAVVTTDLTAADLAKGAKAYVRAEIAAKGAKAKDPKEVQLDGHPGAEMRLEKEQDGKPRDELWRFYVAKGRLFELTVNAPRGMLDADRAAKFFDSFKVLGGVPDPKPSPRRTEPGPPARAVLRGHREAVYCLAFSPDGKILASGGGLPVLVTGLSPEGAGELRLWDVASGTAKARLAGHALMVAGVAFSPDGKTLASASADETVRLWDVATGKERARLKGFVGHTMHGVAFSRGGKLLVTAAGREVRLWHPATGKQRGAFPELADRVEAMALSPNGKLLALGGEASVRLCDVATGRGRLDLKGLGGFVRSLAFSRDGKLLAAAGGDTIAAPRRWAVKVWELPSGKERFARAGEDGPMYAVAFAPDGKTLAVGGGGYEDGRVRDGAGELRLWQATDGKELAVVRPHAQTVSALAFTADGKVLATGSLDKAVKLWDVAALLRGKPKR